MEKQRIVQATCPLAIFSHLFFAILFFLFFSFLFLFFFFAALQGECRWAVLPLENEPLRYEPIERESKDEKGKERRGKKGGKKEYTLAGKGDYCTIECNVNVQNLHYGVLHRPIKFQIWQPHPSPIPHSTHHSTAFLVLFLFPRSLPFLFLFLLPLCRFQQIQSDSLPNLISLFFPKAFRSLSFTPLLFRSFPFSLCSLCSLSLFLAYPTFNLPRHSRQSPPNNSHARLLSSSLRFLLPSPFVFSLHLYIINKRLPAPLSLLSSESPPRPHTPSLPCSTRATRCPRLDPAAAGVAGVAGGA